MDWKTVLMSDLIAEVARIATGRWPEELAVSKAAKELDRRFQPWINVTMDASPGDAEFVPLLTNSALQEALRMLSLPDTLKPWEMDRLHAIQVELERRKKNEGEEDCGAEAYREIVAERGKVTHDDLFEEVRSESAPNPAKVEGEKHEWKEEPLEEERAMRTRQQIQARITRLDQPVPGGRDPDDSVTTKALEWVLDGERLLRAKETVESDPLSELGEGA